MNVSISKNFTPLHLEHVRQDLKILVIVNLTLNLKGKKTVNGRSFAAGHQFRPAAAGRGR